MPSSSPSRTAERKPGREGRRFPPSGSRYCSKIENSSDLTWQLDIKLAKLKILPWFHNSPSTGRARARRGRGIWAASEGHRYRKSVDTSPELSDRRLEIRIKQKTIKWGWLFWSAGWRHCERRLATVTGCGMSPNLAFDWNTWSKNK